MIYRARSKDNKLFIAMYETEKPNIKDFDASSFLIAYNKWQSSKREYKVRESDKEEIHQLILSNFRDSYHKPEKKHSNQMILEYIEALEKGIDCTFLKDRLKFYDKFCCGISQWGKCESEKESSYCARNCTPEPYVAILPLEDKKKNEAETMFREVVSIFHKWNRGDIDKYWLDELKQKFTITRKPNIQEPE